MAGPSFLKAATPEVAAIPGSTLTIRQVMDLILAEIPGAPFRQTVDTVKSGNPDQPVKAIVTTMFATDAVIDKAIEAGANFIIAHEPTFYNHLDETEWLKEDKVYRFKKDKLESHGIVVWRFHDYLHSHRPDMVYMGTLTSLGWQQYYDAGTPGLVVIPAATLGDIVALAKKQLGIEKVKVIGDLSQSCSRIGLAPGAGGGKLQIGLLQRQRPDVLILGELNEWETSEYIRDARYQGEKTALVVLGHSASEEPGLEWLATWLRPKVGSVKITHISSGDPFQTI